MKFKAVSGVGNLWNSVITWVQRDTLLLESAGEMCGISVDGTTF
ncbi:MAG: hypothetical protein WCD89_18770 [Anaerocolumna sp.]